MKNIYILLILSIVLTQAYSLELSDKIKHVVVLMEENRSFDHMFGFMKRGGDFGDIRVDGLFGNESNPVNISDPNSKRLHVNDKALDNCPYDPDHDIGATTERIYSCKYNTTNGEGVSPCINHTSLEGNPTMQGFT